jgi:hypothetical protein
VLPGSPPVDDRLFLGAGGDKEDVPAAGGANASGGNEGVFGTRRPAVAQLCVLPRRAERLLAGVRVSMRHHTWMPGLASMLSVGGPMRGRWIR